MSKAPANRNLLLSVKILIEQARTHVVRNINTTILLTYFQIGRLIVKDEQGGNSRANYAKETLKHLSKYLTKEFGRGYSTDNLQWMRRFYLAYRKYESVIHISAREEATHHKNESAIHKLERQPSAIKQSEIPFTLSWTHYIQLLKIENEEERKFYEIEAAQNNWSVRELTRQFNAAVYERVALSKDKKAVKALAKKVSGLRILQMF